MNIEYVSYANVSHVNKDLWEVSQTLSTVGKVLLKVSGDLASK